MPSSTPGTAGARFGVLAHLHYPGLDEVLGRLSKAADDLGLAAYPERDLGERLRGAAGILEDSAGGSEIAYEEGAGGAVPGSSSYYQWLKVSRAS